MQSKVFIVLQKYQEKEGNNDAFVLGVTHSIKKAQKIVAEEKASILENYKQSLEEMKNDDFFVVEDNPTHFYLADTIECCWDEIVVIVKPIND